MSKVLFSELNLTPKVERAIHKMGYDYATPIQAQAIPLIRTGVDVIAKSQTGTGKTVAFAIPAMEAVDTHEEKPTLQVLILCPTRELAQQADEEVKKLARFKSGIRSVAIYGGAPIDKQCVQLRRANIVIGTPGRVMDHMRRRTMKLEQLKMIVLDEADEMLNMGFKEDIETILQDTPETRQTLLFSATMPPAIVKLAKEFQKDAQIIEINKDQKIIGNVEQSYIDVPRDRKTDALKLLFQFHKPERTIIFCNTKKMADKLTDHLNQNGYSAKSLHSDIKQSQRTAIMQSFKLGKISILVATDIAARGIDVNDIDYVINFDVPQNTEYYVHRIGRTGRAGKSGQSITICAGRREISAMKDISRAVKAEIKQMPLPSGQELQNLNNNKMTDKIEALLQQELRPEFEAIAASLVKKGYSLEKITQAALQLSYGGQKFLDINPLPAPKKEKKKKPENDRKEHSVLYEAIVINVGAKHRVAPNHIVGALTERTDLSGAEIGKIKILPDQSIIDVPQEQLDSIIEAMRGCKIRGYMTKTLACTREMKKNSQSQSKGTATKHKKKNNSFRNQKYRKKA